MTDSAPVIAAPTHRVIVRVARFGEDLARDHVTINAHLHGMVTCATCAAADLIKAESWAELLNSAPRFGLGLQLIASDDAATAIEQFKDTVGRAPDHVLDAGGGLIMPHLPDPSVLQVITFGQPHVALGDLLLMLTLLTTEITEISCDPPGESTAPEWSALTHNATRELIAAEHIRLARYDSLTEI